MVQETIKEPNASATDQAYAAFDSAEAKTGSGYGYPTGDVSLEWEEFTLRCDRA